MRNSRTFSFIAALVVALLLFVAGIGGAGAVTVGDGSSTPSISSDQADYSPGSLVVLSGVGWAPGEGVHLDVNDDLGRTWEYTADVTADDQGAITDTFTLPDWFVATYRVDATGAVSGTVTTTFTDGNIKVSAAIVGGGTATATMSGATFNGNTNCSGTGSPVNKVDTISSGAGDSSLVTTSPTATASGATYDFDHWTYGGVASPAFNGDPLKTCVTGFASGSKDLIALYRARTTTTTLTSSAAPSVYGDALTLTATVISTGGTPSGGTIAFKDGATTISGCGSVSLSVAGTATCSFAALAAGGLSVASHSLTSVYSGSGSFPSSTGNVTQVVNKRTLTGSFTASDKIYDGNTTAHISGRSLSGGIVDSDAVSLSGGDASFGNKSVGANKPVTGNGFSLAGTNAGSYQLASTSLTTTASIGTHALTVNFTAAGKTYDGTTDATITARTLSGVLGGDTVTVSGGTAAFDSKNAGSNKTVTASGFSLAGTDASNYAVTTVNTSTASITAKPITGSFTAQDKTYDGTRAAAIATRALTGVLGNDDVSLSAGTAQFATKDAGSAVAVAGTGFILVGTGVSNYTLTSVADTTANIDRLHVTGAFTASNKEYDGTRAATVTTVSVPGKVGGDDVSLQGTAQFADAHAGTVKTVAFVSGTLTGADAADYTLDGVADTSADITPKALTGSFAAANKGYDGTNAATITDRLLSGVVGGDPVSLTGGVATFATKNVGDSITVTGIGFMLAGASKDDYALGSATLTTKADITKLSVVGHVTVSDKTYDSSTDATINDESVSGAVGGDVVTLTGGNASFGNKNVGTGKTVTLIGATLAGADADNYSLQNPEPATTANITVKHISGSFVSGSKVYDGQVSTTVASRSLTGVLAGDSTYLDGGTATFSNKNVGTGKTVTLTGATLAGLDAGNYALDSVSTSTADITPLSITGSFGAGNKVYDGTTHATVTSRDLTGTVDGDTVSLTGGSAAFGTKNVANGKTVTLIGGALSGSDAGNYTLTNVSTTTADITALSITGSFTADNKFYDGTVSATVLTRSVSGEVTTDQVTLTGGTASFGNKNVGTAKTVTLTGATLAGADADNYNLGSVSTSAADITPLDISGSFTAANKTYDGNTSATVTGRDLTGVIQDDDISLNGGTASFGNKNVANGKTVTLTGAGLSGNDTANYTLTGVGTSTADILSLDITGSFTAANKTYDGNESAEVTHRGLSGVLGTDAVTLTGGTAAFGNKNVGTGKTVTLTGANLTGADADNYTLAAVGTTTADLTAKHITGSFTASNKVYDASTTATVLTRTPTGVITGDEISLSGGNAHFADKNVGNGKTVTLAGATLTGTGAGNYELDSMTTTTADITAFSLTGSFTAANKTYDGTTSTTVSGRDLAGVLQNDDVSLSGGTAAFADKNVGTGKTVTLTDAGLTGIDAGNYSLTSLDATKADITALAITGSFKSDNKVYDGTTSANAHNRSLSGVLGTDAVSLAGGTAAFADKNVGTGKTVTLTGANLAGADADNYTLTSLDATKADITALAITGSFKANSKVYDGQVSATFNSPSLNGVVAGDSVALAGGTATFADKNVGTGKTVTLTGAGLTGIDAGNYSLSSVSQSAAEITPARLTVTADDKAMQMGAAVPTLTGQVVGKIIGDTIVTSYSTTATSSSTGGFYPITPSLAGTSTNVLANYDIRLVTGTLNVTFVWNGFLQPVNDTAHQINVTESKFKLGQTIPLKFDLATVSGANVQQALNPAFSVGNYRAACDSDATTDTLPAVAADPSGVYTFTSGHYQYNWSTKSVTKAGEYRVYATLADGSKPWVDICLR